MDHHSLGHRLPSRCGWTSLRLPSHARKSLWLAQQSDAEAELSDSESGAAHVDKAIDQMVSARLLVVFLIILAHFVFVCVRLMQRKEGVDMVLDMLRKEMHENMKDERFTSPL
jgi:hypothetical protein